MCLCDSKKDVSCSMGVFICNRSGVISDYVCLTNFVTKIQALGHSVLTVSRNSFGPGILNVSGKV